ncbi:MAG: hypothetical protein E4H19_13120 [Chromatiales bacterium]|nr:MAG: hypothetical protein E4H19_13120 [Chromatiales bacterium]
MTQDFVKTVIIRRPAKVATDDRGRTVWVGKVESVELELVSTTALEKILKSDDGKTHGEIRRLARGRKDGVLAKDTATGVFQIVSKDDLRAALEGADVWPPPARVADASAAPIVDKVKQATDELSLVSTQILRKVMKPGGKVEYEKPKTGKKDKFGGFNPYDNN